MDINNPIEEQVAKATSPLRTSSKFILGIFKEDLYRWLTRPRGPVSNEIAKDLLRNLFKAKER